MPRSRLTKTARPPAFIGVDRGRHQRGQSGSMSQQSAQEVIGQRREPQLVLVGVVLEQVGSLGVRDREVHVTSGPGAVRHRLGHERADHAKLTSDFACCHSEQHIAIGRGHGRRIGEVDLKLPIGILVINLINVEACGLKSTHEFFQETPAARESLVVVAGLIECVRVVGRTQRAVGIFHQAA